MELLIITPKTKIFDLLQAYPRLEALLIEVAPQFSKLRNPVLRNTIAKITTLSQAAVIGGLKVDVLVNRLRAEVGQSTVDTLLADGGNYNTTQPDWFQDQLIVRSIAIAGMLEAGEQPVHEVLGALHKLEAGQILQVTAPFIPAPLLDKSLSMGCRHWVHAQNDTSFEIYFSK
ncbi:MAG: DUF1858 domain-containing protein [Bacteroidales bacterium]